MMCKSPEKPAEKQNGSDVTRMITMSDFLLATSSRFFQKSNILAHIAYCEYP